MQWLTCDHAVDHSREPVPDPQSMLDLLKLPCRMPMSALSSLKISRIMLPHHPIRLLEREQRLEADVVVDVGLLPRRRREGETQEM